MTEHLGFDRFDAHTRWRATGHVSGAVDEAEPRTFAIERQGDRWLMTSEDKVLAVGDGHRDLVAAHGGLDRQPAKLGFTPWLSGNLLLQLNMMQRENVSQWDLISGPTASTHANRSATDVKLKHLDHMIILGVDEDTGIWTYLEGDSSLRVVVDELTLNPEASSAFELLELIPDIDLSRRSPADEALTSTVIALEEASGSAVEVIWHEIDTGQFRLVLLDGEGAPQGLITRQHDTTFRHPVFGGIQSRQEGEDGIVQHVDTSSHDAAWVGRIVRALSA